MHKDLDPLPPSSIIPKVNKSGNTVQGKETARDECILQATKKNATEMTDAIAGANRATATAPPACLPGPSRRRLRIQNAVQVMKKKPATRLISSGEDDGMGTSAMAMAVGTDESVQQHWPAMA